jgi:hypothetical protein
VNKPFKDHLKQLYFECLLAGDHILTPTGKIKKPSVALLCQWIKTSWQRIRPEVIVKGFKKCCISYAVDGREDDTLWEDEEDVENVGSESEEAGNCEDSETSWETG